MVILAVVIIASCAAVFYLVREETASRTHTHTDTHPHTDTGASAAGYVAANDTIPSSSSLPPPPLPLSDQSPRRRWYERLPFFSSRKERFPSDDDEETRSGAGMDRSRAWVQSRGRGDMGMKERDVDSMMTTTTRTVFSPALDEKVKEKISATSMTPTMQTYTTYSHTPTHGYHMSGMSIDEASSRVQSPRSSLGFGVGTPPPVSTYVPPAKRTSLYSEPALSVDLDDPSAVPGVGMGMRMSGATQSGNGGVGDMMTMHSPEPKRSSFVVFRPTPRVYSPSESSTGPSPSTSPGLSTSPLGRPGTTSLEPLISATTSRDGGEEDDDIKQPFATRSGTMVRTPVIGSKFIESL